MREGIQGHRQQILATPMGQQFLHLMRKGLIADFCKFPALKELLAVLLERMMEEGPQFMLAKKELEDTGRPTELGEMLDSISDPIEILGGDVSLSLDHPR